MLSVELGGKEGWKRMEWRRSERRARRAVGPGP